MPDIPWQGYKHGQKQRHGVQQVNSKRTIDYYRIIRFFSGVHSCVNGADAIIKWMINVY